MFIKYLKRMRLPRFARNDITILSDFYSKRPYLQKTFKYLFLIGSLSLLLNFVLMSQSARKEKINSLVEELTPTYTIKKSFKNLDIIGFDVLDENRKRITSSKFKFYSGNQFYIVLYGKKKVTEGKASAENKLERCKAFLVHHNGGYFWSENTSYLIGKQEIKDTWEEWKIGGIYKVRFAFEVPEFALPGRYRLELFKEKAQLPKHLRLITLDKINIIIQSSKIHKSEKFEDYNLSLKGCLLNPAVQRNKYIAFPWIGNIIFYIDRDLRNFKKIIISAKGTPALGVYPLLKIYIDKKEIGNVYVNREWNEYEFDIKLNKERHILKVSFNNDGGGPGEDRNMYIKMIKLVR